MGVRVTRISVRDGRQEWEAAPLNLKSAKSLAFPTDLEPGGLHKRTATTHGAVSQDASLSDENGCEAVFCATVFLARALLGWQAMRPLLRPLLVVLTLAPSLLALDPNLSLGRYRMREWGANAGLPQRTVTDLLLDTQGFLWVATQNGLARFDGHDFTNFYLDPQGDVRDVFEDGYMACLLQDRRGTLWIGTRSSGLVRFRDGVFDRFREADGLPADYVTSLAEDAAGRLWVGTPAGLVVRTEAGFAPAPAGLAEKPVQHLLYDSRQRLWVAGQSGLSVLVDGAVNPRPGDGCFQEHTIHALTQRRNGELWVGTAEDGLWVGFDSGEQAVMRFSKLADQPAGLEVQAFCEDRDGNLWLGTTRHGIMQFFEGTLRGFEGPKALRHLRIMSMVEDQEGGLWVGTRNGFFQYYTGRFFSIGKDQGLIASQLWSVCEAPDGVIWMGSEGAGLVRWDKKSFRHYTREQGMPADAVLSVWVTRANEVWAGTRKGVAHLRQGRLRTLTREDGLAGSYTRAITEDSQGRIWLGSKSGVTLYDQGAMVLLTEENGLVANVVRAFFEDRDGDMWIATDHGLSRYRDGRLTNYTTADGLINDSVRALHQSEDGALWIGTYGGLSRYRDGRFSGITHHQGLFQDIIFKVLEDDYGVLWMTSHDGFFSAPIAELNDILDGRKERLTSHIGATTKDRDLVECNGGSSPCGWKAGDGTLLLPSMRGLLILDPGYQGDPAWMPPTYITRILVNGRTQPRNQPLTLASGVSRLEFHFSGISFRQPQNVRYRVMLEGYDSGWDEIGDRRFQYYRDLPPGTYRFRLQSAVEEDRWHESNDVPLVTVVPAWYERTTFWVAAVLLVVVLVIYGHRYRMAHLKQRGRQLEALVQARTEALEKANHELQATQENLVKAAHLAGMAEISADVIHNLGNGLNSVNVAGALIKEHCEKLPVSKLLRVIGLMEGNRQELADFLSHDERGRKVVPFIKSNLLALDRGRKRLENEVDGLVEKTRAMNKIIFAQQALTENRDQYEDVGIIDMVEQVLVLQEESLREHHIRLVTDFEDRPTVRVHKTKFLRAIGNLVKNAWESTMMCDPDEKEVRIHTFQPDPAWVRLEIIDNGTGIPAEDITRVFHQGYSTKPHGHGFSLHYCGNVISEMKGRITVQSQGVGKGATFRVDLPVVG